MARPSLPVRWRPHPRVVDAVVAAVVLAVVVMELAGTPDPGAEPTTLTAYLLAVAFTLPYAFHRDRPIPVLVVTCAAIIAYSAGHYAGYPGFSMFVLVFGLTLHSERGHAVVFYLAGLVTMTVALTLQRESVATASAWVSTLLVLTVAWLGGENLRARRARWSALEERARRLEEEREQQARAAVQEERMRIARELHDVVAHSMSVVAVQAGVAHHVIDKRPELAQEALGAIETTSRAALVELRRMLGVLRGPGETTGLGPSAGLDDLDALVHQLDDAGVEVELRIDGDAGTVPSGVGLSAYRVAQESLTNVLKHGARVARLHVTCRSDAVVVEVTDPGRGERAVEPVPGAGHGMLGMRERVAVFDGQLDAGPDGRGGFRVLATLPYDAVVGPAPQASPVPLDTSR